LIKIKKTDKDVKEEPQTYNLFGVQMSQLKKLDFTSALVGGGAVKGKVAVKVKADVAWMIRMESRVTFIFNWAKWTWNSIRNLDAFPEGTHLKVELEVGWEARATMEGDFQAQVEAGTTIFRYGFLFTFAIGPVPVVIEPFVKLGAGVAVQLPKIEFYLDYVFAERWHVGYEVDTRDKNNRKIGPISQRVKVKSSPLHNEFTIRSGNEPCPIELGVDPKVTPEVGVAFYVLLEGFLKFPISAELTLRFPENRLDLDREEITDQVVNVCADGADSWKKWEVTMWIGVKFGINIGGRIRLEKIPYIGSTIKKAIPSLSWEVETPLLAGRYLLAPTFLGPHDRVWNWFGIKDAKNKPIDNGPLIAFPGLKQCCDGNKVNPALSWKYPRTEPNLAVAGDPGNLGNTVTTDGGKEVKDKPWESSPIIADWEDTMEKTEEVRKNKMDLKTDSMEPMETNRNDPETQKLWEKWQVLKDINHEPEKGDANNDPKKVEPEAQKKKTYRVEPAEKKHYEELYKEYRERKIEIMQDTDREDPMLPVYLFWAKEDFRDYRDDLYKKYNVGKGYKRKVVESVKKDRADLATLETTYHKWRRQALLGPDGHDDGYENMIKSMEALDKFKKKLAKKYATLGIK